MVQLPDRRTDDPCLSTTTSFHSRLTAIVTAERFRSDPSFAIQPGTAPIPCSSGQHQQHRLNRGGDRRLNHALHIIAISRPNHDPATKAYLAPKEAEGKTTKGPPRRLKRTPARRFHHPLSLPAQTPQADRVTSKEIPRHPRERERSDVDGSFVGAAPNPTLCAT